MQNLKAFRIGMIGLIVVIGSLVSVMYGLAYTEKREVLYTNTIKIGGQEVMFRAFYLSSPVALIEVKISASEGTVKWTPHSAVMFEDTLGWFPRKIDGKVNGTIQRWVCETDGGTVKWSIDPENVDMVWYLNLYNPDSYEKEVYIEVTKVWENQNYHDWL